MSAAMSEPTKAPGRDDTGMFRLDANLLVALDALLRERNVTRAAARLGMGQPGLSHALARLRVHFKDALLVREGRQMVLTPRAERLAAPVREIVAGMKRVFADEAAFDPATSQRSFRIAITDGVGYVLMPRVLQAIRAKAPGVALQFVPIPQHPVAEDLTAGRADLAITYFGALPPAIRREALFTEHYVGLVDRRARVRGPLTAARYAAMSHVVVETRPGTYSRLSALLAERGIERRAMVTVPHFLLAPLAVQGGDHVATIGRGLAQCLAQHHPVRVMELSLALPGYEISQIWHERAEADDGLAWLRSHIARVLAPRASKQLRKRRRKDVSRA
jgi:DNA-binding transcriptional LysR family regulator